MIKSAIQIGGRYVAKVSGSLTVVEIKSAPPSGGWFALNCATDRTIRVRGGQRLRKQVSDEQYQRWKEKRATKDLFSASKELE